MPNTVNKALNVPNTGDLVGAWGTAAVNYNMSALDGILGGFATISLSSATTLALTVATGSLTPGSGPNQSQNALLKFTGTLTGNAIIQFAMPGFYIVHNACTVGAFSIKLSPSAGTGNSIGAPPGQKVHVFFDGTDMDYVDMPAVGAALDLHQSASTVPAWITVCTVRPYLIKDGSVYTSSVYPQLAAILGSTFGGNGITTFAVPDERARARLALDTLSVSTGTFAGRLTVVGSGVNGTTMGAAGGSEFMASHTHTGITDLAGAHNHTAQAINGNTAAQGGSGTQGGAQQTITVSTTAAHTHAFTTQATGSGGSGNVMPVIVSFIPLIKT